MTVPNVSFYLPENNNSDDDEFGTNIINMIVAVAVNKQGNWDKSVHCEDICQTRSNLSDKESFTYQMISGTSCGIPGWNDLTNKFSRR